jgi:hypothetical protein
MRQMVPESRRDRDSARRTYGTQEIYDGKEGDGESEDGFVSTGERREARRLGQRARHAVAISDSSLSWC